MAVKRSHVVISLSRSGEDLDGMPEAGDRPDLIVAFSTSGVWPSNVRGVPVVPIFEIVDPGQVTDRSLTGVVEWLTDASHTVGASGCALGAVKSRSGFPLWWCADHSISTFMWLRIRAIEALHALLAEMAPEQVTVWGEDPDQYWLRATVSKVLELWAVVQPGRRINALPSWQAALAGARRRWAGQRNLEVSNIWTPSREISDLPATFDGAGEGLLGGTVLATSGSGGVHRVAAGADFIEAKMRWRRGERFCLGLEVDNGRRRQNLFIADGSVRLGSNDTHREDTSIFHTYLLELEGSRSRLYLDGRLVLEAGSSPSLGAHIEWGHYEGDEITRAEWAWVVWGKREQQPLLDRLKAALLGTVRAQRHSEPGGKSSKLLSSPPQFGLRMPDDFTTLPEPGDVCVVGWGAHLAYFVDGNRPRIVEPYAEGIAEALVRSGLRTSFLAYGQPNQMVLSAFPEAYLIRKLEGWRAASPSYEDAVEELVAAWRGWLGSGNATKLPEYRGIDQDDFALPHLEHLLPDLAVWVQDTAAIEGYVRAHKPRAIIFSNFASSHRHLIEPLKRDGVCVVATSIGVDIHPWLFYGLRSEDPECPRADIYPVWGAWQAERLAASCPTITPVSSGRSRQDTFAKASKPPADWLQQIGLPPEAKKVIVFGDVLLGTLKENILTPKTWTGMVEALLDVVRDYPEIHVVIKPWLGDSLKAVSALAADIDDPRLHIFDPNSPAYHNSQLLAHAVTVVSSPTSFLAEFAAMGGIPILLSLPETRYYHGDRLHDLYGSFCHVVGSTVELQESVRHVILDPQRVSPGAEVREAQVSRYFGPSDGRSAERFADLVKSAIRSH